MQEITNQGGFFRLNEIIPTVSTWMLLEESNKKQSACREFAGYFCFDHDFIRFSYLFY